MYTADRYTRAEVGNLDDNGSARVRESVARTVRLCRELPALAAAWTGAFTRTSSIEVLRDGYLIYVEYIELG